MQQIKLRPSARDGKVRVWDKHDKAWRRVHPIDAREQIALGYATLDGPEGAAPPEDDAGGGDPELDLDKLNAKELDALVAERELNVDLSKAKTLADRRRLVAEALEA